MLPPPHQHATARAALRALSARAPSALPATGSRTPFACAPSTSGLRAFSVSAPARSGESHFDPPSGWLWGVPPGKTAPREGWEGVWMWGFFGSLGLAVVAWNFKPDTNIETWALEEAKRRLQAEGILPEEKS